ADQSPRDGELLLLTAGQVSAHALRHCLQNWKEIIDLGRNLRGATAERRQSDSKVLLNGESRKDASALGHEPQACGSTLVGGKIREVAIPHEYRADGRSQ